VVRGASREPRKTTVEDLQRAKECDGTGSRPPSPRRGWARAGSRDFCRAVLLLALVAGAPIACRTANPRNADLVADIRGYGDGVRWRDFNAAALRIVPARRVAFLETREQLEDDLRVGDWELRRLTYDERQNRAEVHIEWTWHLDSRGIVHRTVTRQMWTRRGDRWIIEREERLRGEPMPGVAEPRRKKGTPRTAGVR
jgi:hypothetical protein